jgi:hypothetical protein
VRALTSIDLLGGGFISNDVITSMVFAININQFPVRLNTMSATFPSIEVVKRFIFPALS